MPIRLDVGVTHTSVVGWNAPHKDISNACRYFKKTSRFSKAFKAKKWDGYTRLYRNGKFPSGLVSRVANVLKKKKVPFNINICFEWPEKRFDWELTGKLTPRDNQVDAINAAVKSKRGIIQCPTGFGKTAVLACGIIANFGVPSLFVCNNNTILYQAKRDIEDSVKYAGEVGLLCDGKKHYSNIVVASIQTLEKLIGSDDILDNYLNTFFKLVIVDECQFLGTTTWKKFMNNCQAPYRFALSATPTREDGADLEIEACTSKKIFELSADDMINKGYLADVDIAFVPFDHGLYNENDQDLVFSEFAEDQIVFNDERNDLIADEALKMVQDEDRYLLILVQRIDHGTEIKRKLHEKGLSLDDVHYLYGESESKIREGVLDQFKKGKFHVLIGSSIFDYGVDMPIASGLINAGAGSSKIKAPQRVGRVIRLFGKNKKAKVIDILDLNVKFFTKQSWKRRSILMEEFGKDRVRVIGGKEYMKKKKEREKQEGDQALKDLGLDEEHIQLANKLYS